MLEKYFLGVVLLLFSKFGLAQLDSNLVPCADLYDLMWDSLNVNKPHALVKDINFNTTLLLSEDSSCSFQHPIRGKINSTYGWRKYRFHKGIDIHLVVGDTIKNAFDGLVRYVKWDYRGFGLYVVVRHYNGLETIYAHLSKALVKRNQFIRAGEFIGLGGNTGRSTGPHLHFETRFQGQPFDPEKIINFQTFSLHTDTLQITKSLFDKLLKAQYAKAYGVYHTIRSGDSLYGLAVRYGTSVSRICRLNGISSKTILRIGRKLRIK